MQNSVDFSTALQKANDLFAAGELVEAEVQFQSILAAEEDNPYALYGLSQLAERINDLDTQEVFLSQAISKLIDKEPGNLSVQLWLTELAEVLYKLNKPEQAMQCLHYFQELLIENLNKI